MSIDSLNDAIKRTTLNINFFVVQLLQLTEMVFLFVLSVKVHLGLQNRLERSENVSIKCKESFGMFRFFSMDMDMKVMI